MNSRAWDLAGFTNPKSGAIEKHFSAADRVMVPIDSGITADGAAIWYEDRGVSVEPQDDVLGRFVKLWEKSPTEILAFARANGPLAIDRVSGKIIEAGEYSKRTDSLDTWRIYSRAADALLNLASTVNEQANRYKGSFRPVAREVKAGMKIGAIDDWAAAYFGSVVEPPRSPVLAAAMVGNILSNWMAIAGPTFTLQWEWKFKESSRPGHLIANGGNWALRVHCHSRLLPRIVMQLMLTVGNLDGLYVCNGCNRPYARDRNRRKPRAGQNNFCVECGVGNRAARKLADRKWRELRGGRSNGETR